MLTACWDRTGHVRVGLLLSARLDNAELFGGIGMFGHVCLQVDV